MTPFPSSTFLRSSIQPPLLPPVSKQLVLSIMPVEQSASSTCPPTTFPLPCSVKILSLSHSFFALPAFEKESLKLQPAGVGDGDGARGYQTIGENVTQGKRDWHEGLDLYRPVPATKPPYSPIMGTNKWPPGEFKEVYEMYIEKLLILGRAVMSAIALGLGEHEDYFEGLVNESFWVMRAIGYPPLQSGDEGGISCGEHTGTRALVID